MDEERKKDFLLNKVFPVSFILCGALVAWSMARAANITTSVVVQNATPVVSAVVLNGASAITLTANATTAININATVTDQNGCSDITAGSSTILLYRSGVTSSTCLTNASNLNCYIATAFTATSSCISSTQINTTTTLGLYYFAQATDASSTFPSQNWVATVIARDGNNATSSADSTGQEVNTLTAINVTTSSINYGTLSANADTGATNQVTTSTNAGNSSTTIQLSAFATLTSGANSIATSSQHYSTSTFTYAGTSTALTASGVTVSGYLLTSPTSTGNVQSPIFWGLSVPAGTATGTYSGTNLFSALFQP